MAESYGVVDVGVVEVMGWTDEGTAVYLVLPPDAPEARPATRCLHQT